MYEKIFDSEFDVISHLSSNTKNNALEKGFKAIYFRNSTQQKEVKNKKVSVKRTNFDDFLFSDFLYINKLHNQYLDNIKNSVLPNMFMSYLHKTELTGARVQVKNSFKKDGIIIEERKNSLIIMHEDNSVNTYPKATNNFILCHDGVKYLFYGRSMKKTRAYKS